MSDPEGPDLESTDRERTEPESTDPEIEGHSSFQGGLLYTALHYLGLNGPGLRTDVLRILIAWGLGWLPLFLIALREGTLVTATDGSVPFIQDLVPQVQFLFVVPLFLQAHRLIEPRMQASVRQFSDTGLIPLERREDFRRALDGAQRMVRSLWPELVLLLLVVGTTVLGVQVPGKGSPGAAGWWKSHVSLPIYQFLLLWWLWRYSTWSLLMFRVSRMDLRLFPAHPDLAGGLGFLAIAQTSFLPFALGLSSVAASVIGQQVIHEGAELADFRVHASVFLAIIVLLYLAPLLCFSPAMSRAKRRGELQYGALASRFVEAFDHKWLAADDQAQESDENMLSAADFSGMADLGASVSTLRKMRVVPLGLDFLLMVVGTALLPAVPLFLTVVSPAQILEVLKSLVF